MFEYEVQGDFMESKDLLDLIFEVTTEGYWDWNLKIDRAYLSPRYCELIGYSPDNTVFDSHFLNSIIHPDDRDHVFRIIEEHLQGKSEISIIEYRMISKNGTVRWIEGRGKIVEFDKQGAPARMVGTIVDITKRKQVDDNVFAVMSELPDVIVARFDRSLRHQYVSSSIEKITGHPKEYFIGKSNRDLGMPEHLVTQWEDAIKCVFETGQPNQIEFNYPSPEGLKYFYSELIPEDCVEGLIANVIGTTRDITERRKTEETLKKSEFFFRESQRAANIGSYSADFIAGSWESSEVLDTIFGIDSNYSRSIQGWIDIVHPDDKDMMVSYLRNEVTLKRRPFSKEYRIIRKTDGETRWVHGCGAAKFDCDGNILSLIGTIQDVTERKQAEKEMRIISERLQLATNSANLGVWDWDLRNNIMIWNDKMFELYGTPREAFSNNIDAWMNGLHPEDKEAAIAECHDAIRGEKKFDTIFRVCHADGTVRHIKASGLVITGDNGTAERMLGINVDISDIIAGEEERIKLEVQLQQAQKMESIGRLAGGVAHDFNNMLTIILGHSELGLIRLDPNHRVRDDLIEIRNTAERSAELTRQLLAFARKQTITPKVLNLNETISGMLKMLQRLIGEDINLVLNPASSLWSVKADTSQIDQILVNLCVNARDAIAGIGVITIDTGNVHTDESSQVPYLKLVPGEYVRFSVSDSGTGMDKETLANIFEPFYTTKEQGKGTGLGLATVYGVVKQNRGFIDVQSEPGAGTKFTIYLPRHEGKSRQVLDETELESVPNGSETILFVEDELAILNIVKIILTEQGYNVLTANSPGEALKIAREYSGEIKLLMTDVVMPEMNGKDLAKNILALFPSIKRLFMSGYTSDVIAHHGVLDEGVYFIQKPFNFTVLATKVREALDSH